MPCKVFHLLNTALLAKKKFFKLKTHGRFQRLICIIFFFLRLIKTRSQFQRFICILIAGKAIVLTSKLMVGFSNFLLFWFGLLFFRLGLFPATWNSIYNEKKFVFHSFRFMPAQLTRFGIDRNRAILSIAWKVILLSKSFSLQRIMFIAPARLFCWVVVGQEIDWALWLDKIVML